MKNIISFFLGVIVIVTLASTSVVAITTVEDYDYSIFTEGSKIYSIGGYLSQESIDTYQPMYQSFEDEMAINMVLIISDDFSGSAEDFADNVYEYAPVGRDYNENLIITVVNMNDRVVTLFTYGSAVSYFADNFKENLLDNVIYANLSNQDYEGLLSEFYSTTSNYVYEQADAGYDVAQEDYSFTASDALLVSLGIGVVITLILLIFNLLQHRTIKRETSAQKNIDRDNTRFTVERDIFISTVTTKVKLPKNDSSSGSAGSGSSKGGSRSF